MGKQNEQTNACLKISVHSVLHVCGITHVTVIQIYVCVSQKNIRNFTQLLILRYYIVRLASKTKSQNDEQRKRSSRQTSCVIARQTENVKEL